MNCGIFLPITAGTDLPNSPFRDAWQPMCGSIRTYAETGGDLSFDRFKEAMSKGRSFISGGPLIDFRVNDLRMGDTLHLPKDGGEITVRAALHSPIELKELVIVQDGNDLDLELRQQKVEGVHRWSIEASVKITESGWLSAWGRGARIEAQKIDAMAHAGVIRVIVGDQPVQSASDAQTLVDSFENLISFYESEGVYETVDQRDSAIGLFTQAIRELEPQLK